MSFRHPDIFIRRELERPAIVFALYRGGLRAAAEITQLWPGGRW